MKHAMQRTLISIVLLSVIGGALAAGATSSHAQEAGDNVLPRDNNAFAFDFYHQAAGEDNLIFSPFSISQAFGMLSAGAQNATWQELKAVMRYTLPQDQLPPAFAALNAALNERPEETNHSTGKRLQLNIANSLWAQDGFPFREAYIETVREFFDGGLNLVDFVRAAEAARESINAWVAEETEDKIQKILPPGAVDSDTRMVLVNAIYFNGSWLHPFEDGATEADDFTLLDGSTVRVPMMYQEESFNYMQEKGFQALELPYLGGDMALLVILPEEGQFATMRAALDRDQFDTIRGALAAQNMQLSMPRFDFESSLNLRPPLKTLGMSAIFDPERADLGGMFDRDAVKANLYLTAALHKATITVDEAGTEAAAATALVVGITSAPIASEPLVVRLDRPFIYAIYDRQTGAILFLGQVMNPAASS